MHQDTFNNPHLSYSQINTYLMCPLKYKFQYIDLIPPAFTSSALVFGSAIHEAVGAFYQSVLEGDYLTVSQVHDVYQQIWESQDKEKEIRFFNGDSGESLSKKAQSMLSVFVEQFDPSMQILGVEEPFSVEINEGIPPLVGWIDSVELSFDGTVTIVDLKTASKRYSEQNVRSNLQLTCYSLGAQSLGFNGATQYRLDVLLKTLKPELVRYETDRSEADRARIVKMIKAVWEGITKGIFFPKEDWQCGQCAYGKMCREW
jgi:putative RecB family exonuclease